MPLSRFDKAFNASLLFGNGSSSPEVKIVDLGAVLWLYIHASSPFSSSKAVKGVACGDLARALSVLPRSVQKTCFCAGTLSVRSPLEHDSDSRVGASDSARDG